LITLWQPDLVGPVFETQCI